MNRSRFLPGLEPCGIALAGALSLALAGCPKPAPSGQARPKAAAAADVSPIKLQVLLQGELQRDPQAVLGEDLINENAALRLAAVRTLAHIQDPSSFELLGKALADEEPSVVEWAAFGLGQLCRGNEADAVPRLALRATSLASLPAVDARDHAIGAIALALGRCASDDAEKTLRSWLKLRPAIAEPATLGLGQIARTRKHLDDPSIADLLDAANKAPASTALYPLESLPSLGPAARARLLEVASKSLTEPSVGRAFAVRALSKAGPEAAEPLRKLIENGNASDAERADAGRALAALGKGAQGELAAALKSRARSLIDGKAWLTSAHGVVLTLLEGLEPNSADPGVLAELAQLPLNDDAPPVARRKVALRCRAASVLAGRASESAQLLACDPAPVAERRAGSLALLQVLGRGPLDKARGAKFLQLVHSDDRVVREAALELLATHDEVPGIPELLASALADRAPGVQATAAKVLTRYPARASVAPARDTSENAAKTPSATPPTDPRVVQALTQQLASVGVSNNIEVSGCLLDAAASLELLGAKPALERACKSANPTLRQHAEKGLHALGEAQPHCPAVVGADTWSGKLPANQRLEFTTDVGPLFINLEGDKSPFAVERFVTLATTGAYDGMAIHRVVPGFVVQFGDPDGDGFGGPDLPALRCQVSAQAFEAGSVGVALAGRDTGLGQFFVTLRAAPHLVGEYSLVGNAEPGWERLAAGDRILKVRLLEAGAK